MPRTHTYTHTHTHTHTHTQVQKLWLIGVYEKIMKTLSGSVYEIMQHLAKRMYPWRDL